jgi:hypothetical protein
MPSFLRNKHAGMTNRLNWDNHAQDREVPMPDDMKYTMNAHLCASKCNEWDDCLIWKLSLEEENRQGVPVCKLGDRYVTITQNLKRCTTDRLPQRHFRCLLGGNTERMDDEPDSQMDRLARVL